MVKYASSLIVAALVAAPVLAQSSWDDFDAREYDDLYTRHPDEVGLTARAPSYDDAPRSIFARTDDFDETFSRRSYGHDGNLAAREIDALYERAEKQLKAHGVPGLFNFMRFGMQQVKQIAHQPPNPSPVQGTKDIDASTDTASTKTPKKPCAEGTEPPTNEPPSSEEAKPEGDNSSDGPADTTADATSDASADTTADSSADGAADSSSTTPEARQFDDDEDMWERDYYSDEDVYGRAYDDGYELDARSDAYGYFDDLD